MPRTKRVAREQEVITRSSYELQHPEDTDDSYLEAHSLDIHWPIKGREVQKFNDVNTRTLSGTRFISRSTIESQLNMWDGFHQLLKNSGLETFFACHEKGYKELMQEFYTTLHKDDRINWYLHCRLNGVGVVIKPNLLRRIFGLPKSNLDAFTTDMNINDIWLSIGGGENWKNKGGVKSAFIRDPTLCIFHKFVAHAIFGKVESNKINQNELLIIWGAINKKKVNIAGLLFNKLYECSRKVGGQQLILGHVITAIANYKNLISPEDLDRFEPVTGLEIDVNSLRAAHIISATDPKVPVPFHRRPAYRNLHRGASSSGTHHMQQEEADDDEPEPSGHHRDTFMPDSPHPESAGTSAPDNFSMGMIMSQLQQMSGQMSDLHGMMHNMDTRMSSLEHNQSRLTRHQQHYFSQMGNIPPPPPSP